MRELKLKDGAKSVKPILLKHLTEERKAELRKEHQEQIERLNNTLIESYILNPAQFGSGSEVAVYVGSLTEMKWVSDRIRWHRETLSDGTDRYFLTLREIYMQLGFRFSSRVLINVFVDTPMTCTVYQCGNYAEGEWVELGRIQGYA